MDVPIFRQKNIVGIEGNTRECLSYANQKVNTKYNHSKIVSSAVELHQKRSKLKRNFNFVCLSVFFSLIANYGKKRRNRKKLEEIPRKYIKH